VKKTVEERNEVSGEAHIGGLERLSVVAAETNHILTGEVSTPDNLIIFQWSQQMGRSNLRLKRSLQCARQLSHESDAPQKIYSGDMAHRLTPRPIRIAH